MILCHADLRGLRGPAAVRRVGRSCSAGWTLCRRNNSFSWWRLVFSCFFFFSSFLPSFLRSSSCKEKRCTKDENISNWSEESVNKDWKGDEVQREREKKKNCFLWRERRLRELGSSLTIKYKVSIGTITATCLQLAPSADFYSFILFFFFFSLSLCC